MNRKQSLQIIAIILLALFILTPAWASDTKIGLVYNKSQSQAFGDGVDRLKDYSNAIEENGGKVIRFFITDNKDAIQKKLKEIDGLILPGGADVNPYLYKEEPYYLLEGVDMSLDELEYELLKYCFKHKVPILGICRGHQITNVYLGGSMYQDIPTQFKGKGKISHRERVEGKSQEIHHDILIKRGSNLHKLLGKTRIKVNSLHHQAIKRLAPGVKIVALTEDGVIEAIEGTSDTFFIGVQFHPERLRKKDPSWNALFKALIKEAAKTKVRSK